MVILARLQWLGDMGHIERMVTVQIIALKKPNLQKNQEMTRGRCTEFGRMRCKNWKVTALKRIIEL